MSCYGNGCGDNGCANSCGNGCSNGGGSWGFGGFGWIVNLLIIIIAVEFLGQIFCGGGGNNGCNNNGC
ncbi:MAG: hypothetical protein RR396_06425 [Clostridiales bacterium]